MDGSNVIAFPGRRLVQAPPQAVLESGRAVDSGAADEIARCRRLAQLYDEIACLIENER